MRWCFSSFSDSFIEGVGGNRQFQRRWLNAAGLAVPAAPAGEGDAGACRQLFFQYVVFITTLFLSVLFGMHFGRVSGVAFTFASWVVSQTLPRADTETIWPNRLAERFHHDSQASCG